MVIPSANAPAHRLAPMPGVLVDRLGRRMRKLRVSLTGSCNFRCTYCMPKDALRHAESRWLRPAEIQAICRELAALGIEEIRLTGGEPTVRREFDEIVASLASIPGIALGLTTNGSRLERHLGHLAACGVGRINVSLDSLDAARFRAITRGGRLDAVLHALHEARDRGFRVKVNTVVMRGVNDDEAVAFHDWSARQGIEVRFLELMRIGPAVAEHPRLFVPASETIAALRAHVDLVEVEVARDSTSFVYATAQGARLGFIASESRPFCGACSRLRLTAEGVLRACLMKEDGLSLRGVPPENYPALLGRVLATKPADRLPSLSQSMHEIGG